MKYLLDTDHISLLQRRSGNAFANLLLRMSQQPSSDFCLSMVSFHEQVLGAHDFINRSQRNSDLLWGYKLLSEVLDGFSKSTVLPFDEAALLVFDDLKLKRVKGSTMDLRIASIALSRNLILLTRNTADFQKVPNLTIEDWTI
jgi:tRNA(fMet)-specific endonuclease VapC